MLRIWSVRLRLAWAIARGVVGSLRAWAHKNKTLPRGVNFFRPRSGTGLGVHTQIIREVVDLTHDSVRDFQFDDGTRSVSATTTLQKTIVAVNPAHMVPVQLLYPTAFRMQNFRAGFIAWDVDRIPLTIRLGFGLLDELWAPSTMGATYLRAVTSKPVYYFPTPITLSHTRHPGLFRDHLGLSEKFVFAFQFDVGSSAERKNPLAAAQMYLDAFPVNNSETHLVLKSTRASQAPQLWSALTALAEEREDITLIDEFWDDDLNQSMYDDIDCYISPHRSEGYGLTVAQAIAHGKYVVATAYGGPMDFMMPDNCGFIPFKMVHVGPNPIYPRRAVWAEPDRQRGAELLRDSFVSQRDAQVKARRASEWALETFTLERAAAFIDERCGNTYR